MGFFSKLFKGPEIDMEKSNANARKMRALFNQVVEDGDSYRLIFGYTEDVSRFNYGFVHGSKSKIGNLLVGWNEASQTIVAVPTVPDLSGCGDPTYYRRSEILKAYRNKYPTDAFIIYPDKKGYIAINAYTTGWKTKSCMSMCHRMRNWPLLPTSSCIASRQSEVKDAFWRNRSVPAVSCGRICLRQFMVPLHRSHIEAAEKAVFAPQRTSPMAPAPPG
nr:hypothetical protein [uncultured Acetatifactor sp.]